MQIKLQRRWLLAFSVAFTLVFFMPFFAIHALANSYQQASCEDDEEEFRVGPGILSIWVNTDFCNYVYQSNDGFASGGVARDGIAPLYPPDYIYPSQIERYGDTPARFTVSYESIDSANEWLTDTSPVIVVEIDGDARAYPLGIMTRHEVANTEIGGVPVAVTFCPLCNTGIVFDRRVDGQELHFGVSGFLRFSDLVMWDHETESWWQQSTGEGLVGDFAGEQLTFVTSSMVGYAQFKDQYPDGQVLSSQGRDYNYNPYAGYDSSTPFAYRGLTDSRLEENDRVLGLIHETDNGSQIATAYGFPTLSETIVANDVVGGELRVVFWQPGATSALDGTNIAESRDVGSANVFNPVLEDGTQLTFSAENTMIMDDQTGSTWNVFGTATSGELEGTQLEQITAPTHFWFAWFAFHPDTVLWQPDTTTDAILAGDSE